MVFTVLGAVAELERSLIAERVRAGLRNAKAKGKRLGRPPLRELSTVEMRRLRSERRQGGVSSALFRKDTEFPFGRHSSYAKERLRNQ
jgi:DNA invertase Pin-like site-specific DNA recombinase